MLHILEAHLKGEHAGKMSKGGKEQQNQGFHGNVQTPWKFGCRQAVIISARLVTQGPRDKTGIQELPVETC